MLAGAYPGAQTKLGGDLRIGTLNSQFIANYSLANYMQFINGVSTVCPIYRIDNAKIDDFGHLSDEDTEYNSSIEDNKDSYSDITNFKLYLVNIVRYRRIIDNLKLTAVVDSPKDTDISSLLSSMWLGFKIILQTGLLDYLNKSIGDKVEIKTDLMKVNLTIAGEASILPGIRETFWKKDKPVFIGLASFFDFYQFYNKSAFLVELDKGFDPEETTNRIYEFLDLIGVPYSQSWIINAQDKIEETINIFYLIQTLLRTVLIFTTIISILSLAISMIQRVNGRTKEIGLLKAMGSSDSQVRWLIFFETLIILLIGVAIGIVSGMIISNSLLKNMGFNAITPMVPNFDVNFIFVSSLSIIIIGLGAALIPSIIATRVEPIRALKHE